MSITLPPLPEPVNKHGFNCIQTLDQLRARDLEVARLVLEAAANVLTMHQIPVGNSAAGELACQWTYDALKECRDNIKSLEFKHE